jgi:hypothetical protein
MHTFKLNRKVAAENFEDECIIANLENGLYYSIQGNAISLISALPFADVDHIVRRLTGSLQDNALDCEQELMEVWRQMLDEGIVAQKETSSIEESSVIGLSSYIPSVLNRYSDMQDLLLLDPIHDVGEDGW